MVEWSRGRCGLEEDVINIKWALAYVALSVRYNRVGVGRSAKGTTRGGGIPTL